jgi:hypothetical protein
MLVSDEFIGAFGSAGLMSAQVPQHPTSIHRVCYQSVVPPTQAIHSGAAFEFHGAGIMVLAPRSEAQRKEL